MRLDEGVVGVADTDGRSAPLGDGIGAAEALAGPEDFRLDHGIETEGRPARHGMAEVDGISEGFAGKAELHRDRPAPRLPLDGHAPLAHGPADLGRPGPERGGKSALQRQRLYDPALADLGQEAECPVEAGLAAAVRTGDDGERAQRQHEIVERAVAGDGNRREHGRHASEASRFGQWECHRGLLSSVVIRMARRDVKRRSPMSSPRPEVP